MSSNVVIAAYARSPFAVGKRGGDLSSVRPDEIAAQVVRGLVVRTGVDPAEIEDVLLGCAMPEGEQGLNLARLVGLLAGLPITVAGATINRFCGSSMQSVHSAAGAIALGAGEAFLCVGVESMSRIPMGGFNPMPHPGLMKQMPGVFMGMGDTAENVAKKWKISRAEQEAFALKSQQKASTARAAGNFKDEIVPIKDGARTVEADSCIRPETTAEGLAGLKLAFDEKGSVTAGTSSPLTDGASAVLVTSEAYAKRKGLKPLARVASVAVAGCEPEIMGIGPIPASRKALERAGIGVDKLDVVELNEAFASQSIAVVRDLGIREEILNIDGGAIALGHPLGATGARIVGKAASLLVRGKGRYALATQCIGGGQGIATVLEAL